MEALPFLVEEVIVLIPLAKRSIEEVEEALKKNKDVFDCLVVGMPDERFGQKIVAVVSTVDNKALNEEELIEKTRSVIAAYKLPKSIIFTDEVKRAQMVRQTTNGLNPMLKEHLS